MDLLLLIAAGLGAGFIGGLLGVGGGIIFTPVLFFYYEALGVDPSIHTPLTLGTSLLGTLVVSLASGWFQHRKGAVVVRVALLVGASSAAAVFLVTRFVTTQPWYDAAVFQVVFSLALGTVAVRMLVGRAEDEPASERSAGGARLMGIGTVAGAVASAVGVGGGIVLVPAYHGLLGLPMHRTVGTSSATIALISLAAVVAYIATGWAAPVPPGAVGFVDVPRGLILAVPAILAARVGVGAAHRVNTKMLRVIFAALALLVAGRLALRVLGG